MIPHNAFQRMWIVVPETLQDLLDGGRVLTCSHEAVQFALAHAENRDLAFARRAELEHSAPARPAYVLLLDADGRDAIESGDTAGVQVDVLDGQATVMGTIRLTGAPNNRLRTEHGSWPVLSTVLSKLRKDDVFAISERHLLSRDWVTYQAMTDGADGQVEARYVTDASKANKVFTGEDQVVFLLLNTSALLALFAATA
jgi:hypothetical protein